MKNKLILFALMLLGAAILSSCAASDPLNSPSPGAPPAAIFDNNGTQVSGF